MVGVYGSSQLRTLEVRLARHDDASLIAALVRASFVTQVQRLGLSERVCPDYAGFETAHRVRRRIDAGSTIAVARKDV